MKHKIKEIYSYYLTNKESQPDQFTCYGNCFRQIGNYISTLLSISEVCVKFPF